MKAKGYFKTPQKIVDLMVATLFGAHSPKPTDQVLDTGCGPGDFIDGIIRWCKNQKIALPRITGVELDSTHGLTAIRRFHDVSEITIEETDYLLQPYAKYNYIIGNPPYVPITELSDEEKKLYKPRFDTAIERFDLYHLFFEKSLKSLEKGGRLIYITPEKFIYTSTTRPLRKLLTTMQVNEIKFLDEDTFEGLTTYPTITVIENSSYLEDTKVIYRDGTVKTVKLPTSGESWSSVLNGKIESDVKYRLKDVCLRISVGIATGADKVFIKKNNTLHEDLKPYSYPTISGKELDSNKDTFTISSSMLVPYGKDGKLLPEEDLGPLARYLSQAHIKNQLNNRKSYSKTWYKFHDSVPLHDILKPKIIFKDITLKPKFWIDELGTIVPMHTVYYIVPREGIKLEDIFDYLRSDFARDWMMIHCQRARGGFIRLQSKVLKEMPIPEELYRSKEKITEQMIPKLEPFIFSDAVRFYWEQRNAQKSKQKQAGGSDQGTRSDVTGGQQMNGFADKIVELLTSVGVYKEDIYVKQKRDLPGYYRSHKGWDILIFSGKRLHAAIELKSQVGPSFGNNFNNRAEEAIGSSEDFWTAYREKAFADSPQPWLGYLFMLEDCHESHVKRGVNEPHFPVMPEFKDTSYAQRYEIFCRKLVLERKYSSACLILSDSMKASIKENYSEPASDLSVNQFLTQLLANLSIAKHLQ